MAPFASILLRTESASSSEIENLTSGGRQIALAELGEHASKNAQLIVGNVRAMQAALSLSESIDGHAILEMHRALLEQSNPDIVGRWRDQQVWIGGGSLGPHAAQFVPPHQDRVPALMDDLLAFANRVDLPVLVHTAIAHAQFETIHPHSAAADTATRAAPSCRTAGKDADPRYPPTPSTGRGRLRAGIGLPVSQSVRSAVRMPLPGSPAGAFPYKRESPWEGLSTDGTVLPGVGLW